MSILLIGAGAGRGGGGSGGSGGGGGGGGALLAYEKYLFIFLRGNLLYDYSWE